MATGAKYPMMDYYPLLDRFFNLVSSTGLYSFTILRPSTHTSAYDWLLALIIIIDGVCFSPNTFLQIFIGMLIIVQ